MSRRERRAREASARRHGAGERGSVAGLQGVMHSLAGAVDRCRALPPGYALVAVVVRAPTATEGPEQIVMTLPRQDPPIARFILEEAIKQLSDEGTSLVDFPRVKPGDCDA